MTGEAQFYVEVVEREDGTSLEELGREEREYISVEVGGTIVYGQRPTMFYLSKNQKALITDLQAEIRMEGDASPERLKGLMQQLEQSGLVLEEEAASLRQHINGLVPQAGL
ncbi:hypothetical protein PZT57_25970 [Pseudomonas aeruginosa]|uniref:hypothetical protein n=1 Tax=Pseudomonas aeruginosa TaxID=287 RepID=UPI002B26CD48|nr:hypothetical protein [Pseudomonas aeruginosa]MEA8592094.1 hypothetical protein [Pseudomonas aeruginosa]